MTLEGNVPAKMVFGQTQCKIIYSLQRHLRKRILLFWYNSVSFNFLNILLHQILYIASKISYEAAEETLPKAQHTHGIEFFHFHFRSKQKFQQSLIFLSNF